MISVVVYGRNDNHGYNLHRRAALSLNCIAEVLTHPDDEILFVDWNTPKRLPPFLTAIGDTLTTRAKSLIRVIRVPSSVHAERFGSLTHLPTVEPVARNVGLVRSNPANRWFLSTNTDMCFLPQGGSLSDIVSDLEDGYYAVPRFELPEVFWESLSRSEPALALEQIQEWRTHFALDSIVESFEFNRFDAPGDFQLAPRQTYLDLGGFEQEMLLGWHVDSNMAKRLWLHFGETKSLEHSLVAFHCNHTRSLTVHHGATRATNDLNKFVFDLKASTATQSEVSRIGLADLNLVVDECATPPIHADLDLPLFATSPQTSSWLKPETMTRCSPKHAISVILDAILTQDKPPSVLYVGDSPVCVELESLERTRVIDELVLDRPAGEKAELPRLTSNQILVFDFSSTRPWLVAKRMAEIALQMLTLDFDRQPLVCTVGAEGNQFDSLVGLVLSAPGSQSAFRVRIGNFRTATRTPDLGQRFRLRTYAAIHSKASGRRLDGTQHSGLGRVLRAFVRLLFAFVRLLALSTRRILEFPIRLLFNVCVALFRMFVPRRIRSRKPRAMDHAGDAISRVFQKLWHQATRLNPYRLLRRFVRSGARRYVAGLESKLVTDGLGAAVMLTRCKTLDHEAELTG